MASEDSLASLQNSPRKIGSRALKKALAAGIARQVFIAADADPAITEPIVQMCHAASVGILWTPSMRRLGQACGIDVGAAAAAVVDDGSKGITP